MSLPKDHLSVTQIRMYLRCPAQYYYHYVQGLKLPPSGAMLLGRAVHSGLEHYFKVKLNSGNSIPLNEVLDVYDTVFEKEKADAVWEEDPDKAKDDGAGLLGLYYKEKALAVIPRGVEIQVMIPVAGTFLLGYVDLITATGEIIDHKVVSRTPPESKINEDIQLSAYALAYWQLYWEMPSEVQFNYMVRNKTPKLITRTAKRRDYDLARFTRIVEGVAGAIRAGMFYPNQDNYLCSPTACGYWEVCHNSI